MSIKKNVLANYLGQGYLSVIAVVTLPLYVRYLGAEAYGLVGFFATMQAWVLLLDLGLSPALAREVVRSRANAAHAAELRVLVRNLELIFVAIGAIVCLAVSLCSEAITHHWLRVEQLPHDEVSRCIALMGGLFAARLLAGLYRGGIQAMEQQVWLNGANVVVTTLRFLGALAVLVWVSRQPSFFFKYQLGVGIVELLLFGVKFRSLLPRKGSGSEPLAESSRRLFRFAGSSAYLSLAWVLQTQVDKLILSRVLPLTAYGYFSTAVAIAGVIQTAAGPVSAAFIPRMTYLFSEGKEAEMRGLYSSSTQVTLVITAALSGVLIMLPEPLLRAWTNDPRLAASVAPILIWYAAGNMILSVSAFQYYLQYAHGRLKLHVVYNTLLIAVSIPAICGASTANGAIGAGMAWFFLRLASFAVWPAFIHSRFMPGFHRGWLTADIAPIVAVSGAAFVAIHNLPIPFGRLDRVQSLGAIAAVGLLVLVLNVLFSSACRAMVRARLSSPLA